MHKNVVFGLGVALAALQLSENAVAQQAPQGAPAGAQAGPRQRPSGSGLADGEDEILVTGQQPRGSIPGDVKPETTLGPLEIRAYGASSVAELLTSLSPQTGSARGRGGRPIVLLNGRRVTSFDEIRNLPAEAILRVEVFTEDVALQYGFSADQRVVNIILRRRYKAITTEADGGARGNESASQASAEIGYLRLTQNDRVNVDAKYSRAGAVGELDRGVTPNPLGPDDRDLRTLSPLNRTYDGTAVINHAFNKVWAGTASATLTANGTSGLLGVDAASGAAINSEGQDRTARFGFSLDAGTTNWVVTSSLNITRDHAISDVIRPSVGSSSRSDSTDTTVEGIVNASGQVFQLPAGGARLNLRGSASEERFNGVSTRASLETETALNREQYGLRGTLILPLASRRRAVGKIGDLYGNVSGSVTKYSDFQTISSIGAGLTWSPVESFRVSAQGDWSDNAPSLRQLGDPVLSTPNVFTYDPQTGNTTAVTIISGGAADLRAEKRKDLTIDASWSPAKVSGLTFSTSFVRNRTDNPISGFPALSAAVLDAFDARFTRDAAGDLLTVDRRPINFDSRTTNTIRTGFTFSSSFGPKIQPPWGSGPPPWLRPQANAQQAQQPAANGQAGAPSAPTQDETAKAQTSNASASTSSGETKTPKEERPWRPPPGFYPPPGGFQGFRGPGGGAPDGQGRGGFFGGAQAPKVGQYSFSIFYTRRLSDSVVLSPGAPALDLVAAAPLGGALGGGPDRLEFDGGFSYRGGGLRLNGTWDSGYQVPGAAPNLDVFYSGLTTINVRAFVGFDSRPNLVRRYPILRGVRIVLRADNLFDTAPRVTDRAGAVPYAFQSGFLAPTGRSWQIGLRKQF